MGKYTFAYIYNYRKSKGISKVAMFSMFVSFREDKQKDTSTRDPSITLDGFLMASWDIVTKKNGDFMRSMGSHRISRNSPQELCLMVNPGQLGHGDDQE